ncbi:MAG: hypothetical protein JWO44_968 [Bacteroidetes bacterium]|jgi:hypothetical protein|nr:hypothetical protein [Bacteroidota bacterium]
MKTEYNSSPKDEAVVNHSEAVVDEHVTNGYDEASNPLENKYDKPGREEDPDTTRKDPEWDQPKRENDNDKSGNDDDADRTGSDDDNDTTTP